MRQRKTVLTLRGFDVMRDLKNLPNQSFDIGWLTGITMCLSDVSNGCVIVFSK